MVLKMFSDIEKTWEIFKNWSNPYIPENSKNAETEKKKLIGEEAKFKKKKWQQAKTKRI